MSVLQSYKQTFDLHRTQFDGWTFHGNWWYFDAELKEAGRVGVLKQVWIYPKQVELVVNPPIVDP